MKGEFNKLRVKYLISFMFFSIGVLLILCFTSWGIEEIKLGYISSAIFCFITAFIGWICLFLSYIFVALDSDAFFEVDDQHIRAKYSIHKKLDINVKNIKEATVLDGVLVLNIGEKNICISNLNKSDVICDYIISKISKASKVNLETEKIIYNKLHKDFTIYTSVTIFMIILCFINIILCVYLTGGKDIKEFTKFDDSIFIILTGIEMLTVILTFVFASLAGKININLKWTKQKLLRAMALENKNKNLENYKNIVDIKYFDGYTSRVIISKINDQQYDSVVECFDLKSKSWYFTGTYFTSKILSDAYDHIDYVFSNINFED